MNSGQLNDVLPTCVHRFLQFLNVSRQFSRRGFSGKEIDSLLCIQPFRLGTVVWIYFLSDDIWGSLECHVTTKNKGWNSDLIILSSNQSPADLVLVLTSC